MSKKEGANKKKSHNAIHNLKAFEAVFRAECQVRGCAPHKPLLRALQEAAVASASSSSNKSAAAAGKKVATAKRAAVCDAVSLTGTDAGVVCAAAAGLAGYPSCRALRLVDCRLGDTGLGAVAALLRGSACPWWRGSRLTALEIWATGGGDGGGSTGAAAAAPTRELQSASAAAPPAAGVVAVPDAAAAAAAGGQGDATAPAAVQGAEQPQQQQAAQQASTAALAGAALAASARKPTAAPRPATSPAVGRSPARPRGGRQLVSVPSFGLLRPQTPKPKTQRPAIVAAAAADGQTTPGDDGSGTPLLDGRRFDSQLVIAQAALRDRAPGREELPPPLSRLRTPLEARSGCLHATLRGSNLLPTGGTAGMQPPLSADQACPTTAPQQQQQQQSPPLLETNPFGPAALRGFSLALGASGLALSTLVIDGVPLGDAGIELIAPGLQRCSTLTALSLRGCGLGPAGAAALAAALAPPPAAPSNAAAAAAAIGVATAPAAAVAPAGHHSRFRPPTLVIASASGTAVAGGGNGGLGFSAGSAAAPAATGPWRGPAGLRALALSSNPLGAGGVLALEPLLRQAPALEELALADVGLTADGTVAVQALVSALLAGAPVIASLDLRLNYIGDRGATFLLPLLPARPTLTTIKITPHLGRSMVRQLLALVEANAKAAAAGRRRRKSGAGSTKQAAAPARR